MSQQQLSVEDCIAEEMMRYGGEIPQAKFFVPYIQFITLMSKMHGGAVYDPPGNTVSYPSGWDIRPEAKYPGCLMTRALESQTSERHALGEILSEANSGSIHDDITSVMLWLADAMDPLGTVNWYDASHKYAINALQKIWWLQAAQHIHDAGLPWAMIPEAGDRYAESCRNALLGAKPSDRQPVPR